MKTTLQLLLLKCLYQIGLRSLWLVHQSMMQSNPNKTVVAIGQRSQDGDAAQNAPALNRVFFRLEKSAAALCRLQRSLRGVLCKLAASSFRLSKTRASWLPKSNMSPLMWTSSSRAVTQSRPCSSFDDQTIKRSGASLFTNSQWNHSFGWNVSSLRIKPTARERLKTEMKGSATLWLSLILNDYR